MKKKAKKEKSKNKKQNKEKLNNSELSEELQEDESFTLFNDDNKKIIEEDKNDSNNNLNNKVDQDIQKDIFEQALSLLDENCRKGMILEKEYEPKFSINYLNEKFMTIPLFTPSTRLNNALQVEEKNECFIYYYTHKKSLYPTIYNQLIGISGSRAMLLDKDRDFIYADSTSIVFTNQKNFINLNILINEYIYPLLKTFKISEEAKNLFIDKLLNNIYINEYLTYEELFIKINELNINIMEHKINNIGLIIIDGINSINSQKAEFTKANNGNNYILNFHKYNIPYKGNINSNKKKNNRNSMENKRAKSLYWDNSAIKENIYGYNSGKKKNNNSDSCDSNTSIETMQKNIVNLIMNYQEKYNFNLILTVFDYTQDNFYNLNYSGKASYKEMNKNTYTVNVKELQKENCYFTFKLPKVFFPKKIMFIEPINLCVNYNENIFGLITNPINTLNLEFQVFKKEKNDYRPTRILDKIEYVYK